jgi:hypothetical protein
VANHVTGSGGTGAQVGGEAGKGDGFPRPEQPVQGFSGARGGQAAHIGRCR